MKETMQKKYVALSFDVEEFDLPREYGVPISTVRQIEVSSEGLSSVLDLLAGLGVKATFFCTAFFAQQAPLLIKRIVAEGHQVESHGLHHSKFEKGDLLKAREILEQISGQSVTGYRAPRMAEVSHGELLESGYKWDSSLNPCYLPGRYNNSKAPILPFRTPEGLMELPASVSPKMRLPLFWLSFHNLPLWYYKYLCRRALNNTGLLNIYFHPWEFSGQLRNAQFRVPFYIRRNSGEALLRRLARFIDALKTNESVEFVTLAQYLVCSLERS